MKIIYNNVIPFPGYKAINICGILFAREGATINERTIRHESIHTEQIKEMLVIGFYLWYVVEWVVNIFKYGYAEAYDHIGFEIEAYAHQDDADYLSNRKHYAWI